MHLRADRFLAISKASDYITSLLLLALLDDLMKRFTPLAGMFALLAILLAGCNQPNGSANSVLIVDLAAVAQATGEEQRMQQASQEAIAEFNVQLQSRAQALQEGLEVQRGLAGDSPTAEQEQALQESAMAAQQEYAQMQAGAQQQIQELEVNMVLEYRERLTPIVENIAQSRGAEAVLLSDTAVFWINPDADITDEVIAVISAESALEEATAEVIEPEAVMEVETMETESMEMEPMETQEAGSESPEPAAAE